MAGELPEHIMKPSKDGFRCWCHGESTVYSFKNTSGQELFQKVRRPVDEEAHGRSKAMRYRYSTGENTFTWKKPPNADNILYGLDQDLTGKVYLVEGEKDADSLRAAGVVAVSHHQGGENPMTPSQAGWLLKAKKVIIVADKDHAGAYCAAAHYNLFRDLGLSKIAIKRAAEGKDATDHLEAGYSVSEFVPANLKRFAKVAKDYARYKAKVRTASDHGPFYRANVGS